MSGNQFYRRVPGWTDEQGRHRVDPEPVPATESGGMSDLPESLFLKTYREVEMEILDSHGLRPQDDAEIANLVQGITMDRVIEAKVREWMERQP